MHGKFEVMFSKAWADGRKEAIKRLAEYSRRPDDRRAVKRYLQTFDAQLPEECPYLIEHVAGYDPRRDKEPRVNVWPPEIAKIFNRVLGTKYEILRAPSLVQRDPRGRGRLRGRS